MIRKSVPAGL